MGFYDGEESGQSPGAAPRIRRRKVGRSLTAQEIARLDADALRQRRRRARERAARTAVRIRSSSRHALMAGAVLIGMCGGALAGFGYVRADGGQALAEGSQVTPAAADTTSKSSEADRNFTDRLDAISETLALIRTDLKGAARKPSESKPARMATAPASQPVVSRSPKASLDDVRSWTADSGAWSSAILKDWADCVGVDLDWQADIDIQLEVPLKVEGDFQEAVTSLLDGLSHKSPRPRGHLHLNHKTGRPALVVAAEGNPDGP